VSLAVAITLLILGRLSGESDPRRVARWVHVASGAAMTLSALIPAFHSVVAITKYVLMEISAAALLLVFGLVLGARLGPREARKTAARVGLGGMLGGLCAGVILKLGAQLVGSRALFLVAAAAAAAPALWLVAGPAPTSAPIRPAVHRNAAEVRALAPYGRWVALTTLLMVGATTLIDYQYRAAAAMWFRGDAITEFFGDVALLAGVATLVFQLGFLNRLLDQLGLFLTASVMPGALFLASTAFGLFPAWLSMLVLKVVDSGANMSVQQATGSLLLAPLGARARAVWQSRIDGLAKRGGQALAGLFLVYTSFSPRALVPVVLALSAAWLVALLSTRRRYVSLLSALVASPEGHDTQLAAYDETIVKRLEVELITADAPRAGVVLDLLEQAGHEVSRTIVERAVQREPGGPLAARLMEHLAAMDNREALSEFAGHADSALATKALSALAELHPADSAPAAQKILADERSPLHLRALAAGLLADRDEKAGEAALKFAKSADPTTRLNVTHGLAKATAGSPGLVGEVLCRLAEDKDPLVARTALLALGAHPSEKSCDVALRAVSRRRLRSAAMRALADFGPPIAPRLATEIKDTGDDVARATALIWVLGTLAAGASVRSLVDVLNEPHVAVRLAAAAALTSLHRRRPDIALPLETITERFVPEIAYYAQMRDAGLCALPTSNAAKLLVRAVQQRSQASLETLLRLMSLRYERTAMQGAFVAMSSRDPRQRQLALELLDALLDSPVRQALGMAVGDRSRARHARDPERILASLEKESDGFLRALTRTVLSQMHGDGRAAEGYMVTQGLVDQILELQSVTIFQQASAEDLAEVASLTSVQTFDKGAVIYREGDVGDAFYIVRTGGVTLTRGSKVVERLGPGESFGAVAVLDRLPRELTATAASPTALLAISGEDFVQLLADRPLLMHSVFRALTGYLRSRWEKTDGGKKIN
jgi:HEAT repeat protein